MDSEACCTCATLLSSIPPQYDEKTEKPARHERRLECCGRTICAGCITDNPRFSTYCPFCQKSTERSPLPQGLRDPPPYSPSTSPCHNHIHMNKKTDNDDPPAYTASTSSYMLSEKPGISDGPAENVLHFVNPSLDSISSLALRYGVPNEALRRKNGLFADHLLAARRTILIPGEYYKGGVSLSPRPVEGEEEELRKAKVRRWMVACKVSEYDVALLYLKQHNYDLEAAIEAYKEDERWEKEHPLENFNKSKSKTAQRPGKRRFGLGSSLTGQLS
ncbi:hypothetical protein M501DRAFT_985858 [Patellaria atrata CBS 101060]|uniref:LysM domain-containing protein n=1 Tax=Patellaria atrata CBS 101060 TaxID=1346257 RepID=A0A9P4VVN8_9PEZI|nr:hypothetical protein M501DRAFT_985858 [Patellaria atrata CBS 101060]